MQTQALGVALTGRGFIAAALKAARCSQPHWCVSEQWSMGYFHGDDCQTVRVPFYSGRVLLVTTVEVGRVVLERALQVACWIDREDSG